MQCHGHVFWALCLACSSNLQKHVDESSHMSMQPSHLQHHPLPRALYLPPSDPLLEHLELPGSYMDPVMHDAPVAAGYGHKADAHVNHQGPHEPRATSAHPAGQRMPSQHMQREQLPANGSATLREAARELAAKPAAASSAPDAGASQQAPVRPDAAAPRKKADDSGTGAFQNTLLNYIKANEFLRANAHQGDY